MARLLAMTLDLRPTRRDQPKITLVEEPRGRRRLSGGANAGGSAKSGRGGKGARAESERARAERERGGQRASAGRKARTGARRAGKRARAERERGRRKVRELGRKSERARAEREQGREPESGARAESERGRKASDGGEWASKSGAPSAFSNLAYVVPGPGQTVRGIVDRADWTDRCRSQPSLREKRPRSSDVEGTDCLGEPARPTAQ
jgi:hypothetical protein